ncbi:hypothetical protein AXE80_10745 [Wenyingzhuangia fucanilytica]|uniref:Zinc finger CHC2-type domain-containing protein n=1 Tax=Wenyingzhuangia fucanilytica TaxID=1790137 RepID=A0A1B1Y7G4_9FLAO|nr:CHC2 zinc finger domain-containing protein [Wenyingzhuangia fucanilytica]ANW96721.1 hypothetical protein AXE80_10745 [Wenyingzhuangia fucanilytica]
MTYIPDDKKNEIIEKATLENVLNDFHSFKKSGSSKVTDCPKCGGKDKLTFTPAKKVVKCFVCDLGVKTPANYLKKFHGKNFVETLTDLARIENISIDDIPPAPKTQKKSKLVASVKNLPVKPKPQTPKYTNGSYLDAMLKESGLTMEDITSEIQVDENTKVLTPAFQTGSVDAAFKIIPGVDVIIKYYDLESKPMTYYKKLANGNISPKPLEFYRVRYQTPEAHLDSKGKPTKYRSPYGSDTKVYLPKILREKYQQGSRIKTLYIQEGEKKAEKACKHNMISVGVMGIHNIASKKSLPAEFELIIRKCQVENVVFVLDADWNELGSLEKGAPADYRPYSFYKAVQNFKDYFYAFTNNAIYLNIFFAHVKENQSKDKGLDDLLTNTLYGAEDKLEAQCEKAMVDPSGVADYLQFYKITSQSDYKIKELWHIQSTQAFIEHYKDEIKKANIEVFTAGRIKWRFTEDDKVEMAQPIEVQETYWDEQTKKIKGGGTEVTGIKFNYNRCYKFLQNRGFGRYKLSEKEYLFIHKENTIVKEVNASYIKDFIIDFTRALGEFEYENVLNLLFSGGKQYLGDASLGNLQYDDPNFHNNDIGVQYMFFKDNYWKITKDGIEENLLQNLPGYVWKDKIRDFKPKKLNALIENITKIDDEVVKANPSLKNYQGDNWLFDITDTGDECDFLRFLFNASDFNHQNHTRDESTYTIEEQLDRNKHFLNKLSCLGFLLHEYRNPDVLKAVVAMDGKDSEGSASNGRSGKSLLGEFVRWLIKTKYIPGTKNNLTEDKYIWEGIDERTCLVFIDDVLANFNFKRIFPEITGDFEVEGKGDKKITIPKEKAPKFYITTNHALKGEGGSYNDRQIGVAFSDWYSEHYKPTNDSTNNSKFFEYWDYTQANLSTNLAATALQVYFQFGIIQAPTKKLKRRKLRQDIGEDFMEWADEIFSDYNNLNKKLPKSGLYNGVLHPNSKSSFSGLSFIQKYPQQKIYTNPRKFKEKLIKYAEYKGYIFNPSSNGDNIKINSVEYVEMFVSEEELQTLINQSNEVF